MPRINPNVPYDPSDRASILRYARGLIGMTVGDIKRIAPREYGMGNKGAIGEIIETGYFGIEPNNEAVPDFEDAELELKCTGLVRNRSGRLEAKERLSLGMIDYMSIVNESFESSILKKCQNMLIVFYEFLPGRPVDEFRIVGCAIKSFSEEDIRVMTEDWLTIQSLVVSGKAEDISSSSTKYLEAATKGPGHNKGLRSQPFSDVKVKPRAYALKKSMVTHVYREYLDIDDPRNRLEGWDETESFEMTVLRRFKPYEGMEVEDILTGLGLEDTVDKGKYALIARRIMGVKGKRVEEFDKSNILMKTLRVKSNGTPKESMSFPYFRIDDIIEGTWDESEFHETLDRQFLFVIFDLKDDGRVIFNTAKFWTMPPEDLAEAQRVWELTRARLIERRMDSLPKSSESRVAHVRPHARNKMDTYTGNDGKKYEKKSFWLNANYLKDVIGRLRK